MFWQCSSMVLRESSAPPLSCLHKGQHSAAESFIAYLPSQDLLDDNQSPQTSATKEGLTLGRASTMVVLFMISVFPNGCSEGRGCLEEGCLGLPGVFPDILELRFSLGNEGNDDKNLNSQTWPGTPRRPSPRHPRPPELLL